MALVIVQVTACKQPSKEATSQNTLANSPVTLLGNPSLANSSLPRLFSNGKELFLSWVTQKDSVVTLYYATFHNGIWTPSEAICSGSDWFVNWADFPQIAENNGNILTSYLQKSAEDTYAYDIKLNLYNESAQTWKKNMLFHTDGTQTEHGFVSIKPYVGNSFFVTWLDGRNTVGGHDSHAAHGFGAMNLRGAIVFEDGTIDYDKILDDRVCDCCNTAAAIGANDELMVVYRDRSEDEIRDVAIKRWTRDSNWIAPKIIGNDHWRIEGCPVNGPAIDAFENSSAVAWFTGVNDEGKVQLAFSPNYDNPIRVDGGNATGRVDVVMLSETEAAVLWMEPQGNEEVIRLVKVNAEGNKGNPVTITKTSPERASGFPQLEKLGDTLYIAWTVSGKTDSKIQLATVSLETL
ncbi:MAG: hypothetical protein R2793_10720 [Flavobacteriaceae bacterium]